MLAEFLTTHRFLLIERCRSMAAARSAHLAASAAASGGIPAFLDQVIEALTDERFSDTTPSERLSGRAGGGRSEVGDRAALHGRHLLDQGCTLDNVVRDYGDVCQAVTNLALANGMVIEVSEFQMFNRCLDDAIAGAVTEYSSGQTAAAAKVSVDALNSRLGSLAHELRNSLHVATYAADAVKSGRVGVSGATGAMLDRSLQTMRRLVDRALIEVRVTAGVPPRFQTINVAEFIHEAAASAVLDARAHECQFTVMPIASDVAVEADPDMLASALGNLLQNAFKFTHAHSEVRLSAEVVAERVLIAVVDHCGGLPPGLAEDLLKPFVQQGADRSGLGLGLDISRRATQANNGLLRVRDVPGQGCVFTMDLPVASNRRKPTGIEETSYSVAVAGRPY